MVLAAQAAHHFEAAEEQGPLGRSTKVAVGLKLAAQEVLEAPKVRAALSLRYSISFWWAWKKACEVCWKGSAERRVLEALSLGLEGRTPGFEEQVPQELDELGGRVPLELVERTCREPEAQAPPWARRRSISVLGYRQPGCPRVEGLTAAALAASLVPVILVALTRA